MTKNYILFNSKGEGKTTGWETERKISKSSVT